MATSEVVAEDKSWYYGERYALYNLNAQSVICYPVHEELVRVKQGKSYTVRGYAYNDVGMRVGRVAISIDQGHTWKLAKIDYPQNRYRDATNYPEVFSGKLDMSDREHSFFWCFWDIEAPSLSCLKQKILSFEPWMKV